MGPPCTITTSLFAILITLLSLSEKLSAQQQPQTPCLFFFGDSQFDNGNNNPLLTFAKVNYSPYGIDFPGGATGRFANGRNVPDYLAELLGFPAPIPPFATARGSSILRGVNYASGGAGILDGTGLLLRSRVRMNEQVRNHRSIVSRIAALQGRSEREVRSEYLSRCVYVVNIGSNDYLNNYLVPFLPTRFLFNPDEYAQRLNRELSTQLRNLYDLGAIKIAVFSVGLIGCVPQQLAAGTPSNATGCVDSVNSLVVPYNTRLKALIDNLNLGLPNARFTYINATSIAMGDPRLSGIRVPNRACCRTEAVSGLCVGNSIPCANRNEYSFWDNFHTTSLVNNVTASRAYNATMPEDATPLDIRQLAQQ